MENGKQFTPRTENLPLKENDAELAQAMITAGEKILPALGSGEESHILRRFLQDAARLLQANALTHLKQVSLQMHGYLFLNQQWERLDGHNLLQEAPGLQADLISFKVALLDLARSQEEREVIYGK